MRELVNKIRRWWMKLRLQPIRVFCFHQVSETFDADLMWECDWLQIDRFKQRITELQSEYTFITLAEAHHKLSHDRIRYKKYAVLTTDDAGNCILDIMPWLAERNIPVTLFIPPAFIKGENKQHKCGVSMTESQLKDMLDKYGSLIAIANHGYNHAEATSLPSHELLEDVRKAEDYLNIYKEYIRYYAYPGGKHSHVTDSLLQNEGIVPVYCDGQMNYNECKVIHREIIE